MTDSLQRYRTKRDFSRTSEPDGSDSRTGPSRSFVVQKHAARRLHYDFRLELNGTLKSWAVPKGPSLDPSHKRMAVHVEDHPLAYADFEGKIPAGQYGAGSVIVWDRGEWVPMGNAEAGYRSGKLEFELHGEKLRGRWILVRMKRREAERQEAWLLMKQKDDASRSAKDYDVLEARPESVAASGSRRPGEAKRRVPIVPKKAALPRALQPQLATLARQAPQEPGWLGELKFDGYRLLARIEGSRVNLFTRNGNDWTAQLKVLARQIRALDIESGWIDGELVKLNANGMPDFQELQNALRAPVPGDLHYFAFDVPFLNGRDLRRVPLCERRALLASCFRNSTPEGIRFSEGFSQPATDLLRSACALGAEGIIVKRENSSYVSGRTTTWLKLKCTQRQEFVIGGFTDPSGERRGLGALLLGLGDDAGKLRYVGRAGTGFTSDTLRELRSRLDPLKRPHPPFANLPASVKGHWVKPELVAEVSFSQWTRDGLLRQAVFKGLRMDKAASSVRQEKASGTPAGSRTARPRRSISSGRLTHPERIIDSSTGITKAELASYYAAVAKRLLADLARRPVSLLRAPAGIEAELFFQKHAKGPGITGVKKLDRTLDPGHDPLLQVQTVEALSGCVQMNVIEFHCWNARVSNLERPDRIIFDLDPGEGLPWLRVVEGAQLLRALLAELNLESMVKTSGGKGLHVTVPFAARYGWDRVNALAKAVVVHLAQAMPDRFVSKSGPRNRIGKIFIDYLRNRRGATTVAAWSARARPGIGVSVPVSWSELDALRGGDHWTIRSVDERLPLPDPWIEPGSASRQSLARAMTALDVGI